VKIRALTILLLALFIIGCSSKVKKIDQKIPPTKQVVLFQYSFINHAWGYQNRGWFVNNHGLVRAYQVRDPNLWHEPVESGSDAGYISMENLLANYALADKVFFEYSHFDLVNNMKFIKDAVSGELTSPARTAYDAGRQEYLAYYWDDAKKMYKQVILAVTGDWTQINQSPAADTLYEWLQGLEPFYQDSLRAWQP
jgi:hypothetical protein